MASKQAHIVSLFLLGGSLNLKPGGKKQKLDQLCNLA
jgi:hypothetical protein